MKTFFVGDLHFFMVCSYEARLQFGALPSEMRFCILAFGQFAPITLRQLAFCFEGSLVACRRLAANTGFQKKKEKVRRASGSCRGGSR